MRHELEIDPTIPLMGASSGTDSNLTIPENLPGDIFTSPRLTGSLWFITVSGAAVAININSPAVWGTNNIIEPGSYLASALRLPPGGKLHFVTAGGSGFVSLHRAVRAS